MGRRGGGGNIFLRGRNAHQAPLQLKTFSAIKRGLVPVTGGVRSPCGAIGSPYGEIRSLTDLV